MRALSTDRSHLSASSAECISLEEKHGSFNHAALPVVLTRGYGTRVWDIEGREYLDFLSAHGAVSHGALPPSTGNRISFTGRHIKSNIA